MTTIAGLAGPAPSIDRSLAEPATEREPGLVDAVDQAEIIRDTRSRARAEIPAPDRRSALLTGGSFVLVVTAWLVLAPPAWPPALLLLGCIAAHAFASSVEFEIGPGSAVPTMPILVVTLFLLPPQLVPLVPLFGLIVAAWIARLRDPSRHERLPVLAGSAWHVVGPAAVFALAGLHGPSLDDVPVYIVALAAQFGCDAASSWVRTCYGLAIPVRRLADALRFTFLADLLLAPMGLAAALAMPRSAGGLLLLMPPIVLLAVLRLDRETQISRAVVLSEAFTRTADTARRDVLTGLRNRLAWEEAVALWVQSPTPVSVVLADVDGLKVANDAFGHDAGDRLLIAIGDLISSATPGDGSAIAARLGGDEFGILLPGELAGRAREIVNALRTTVELTPHTEAHPRVSASIGYGVATTGAGLPAALVEADRGVYYDKSRRGATRV